MNKSLIRTSLSSPEGGFDVRSQCASFCGREQKHGNVIGIFQIVQKFSKKAKYAEIGFDIQIFREILCLRTSH